MNGSKTLKEIFVGVLGGVSFLTIMLGFQSIANKSNGTIFIACGVSLFIGTLIIAKIIKV